MCGILFSTCISANKHGENENYGEKHDSRDVDNSDDMENWDQIPSERSISLDDELVRNRGPDVTSSHSINLTEKLKGHMVGSVLHLRGQLTPQPAVDEEGNALLWNGEIFDGIQVEKHQNDTEILLRLLKACSSEESILHCLEKVQGPWAFVYWQASKKKLWFGRDMFGRRSLLWHLPLFESDLFLLSSVIVGDFEYTEIPSVGIFSLDFSTHVATGLARCEKLSSNIPSLTLYPWLDCRWPGTTECVCDTEDETLMMKLSSTWQDSLISVTLNRQQILKSWIPPINKSIPNLDNVSSETNLANHDGENQVGANLLLEQQNGDDDLNSLSHKLIKVLESAVHRRVNNLPILQHSSRVPEACENRHVSKAQIAVLFSGGLDSTVLAALLDRCLPEDEEIDLLNVAFEQSKARTPPHSKQKQRKRKQQKKDKITTAAHTAFEPDLEPNETDSSFPKNMSSSTHNPISSLCKSDSTSVLPIDISKNGETQHEQPSLCGTALEHDKLCDQFGDSKISDKGSAGLSNGATPLLNADNNCSSNATDMASSSRPDDFDPFNVPDRQTGRVALSELNPNRKWNFIEINVTQEELRSLRLSRIRKLIYPLNTVLDDSIGCAIWFAARGRGNLGSDRNQPIISHAKVILCGMAADEQFAGYSRHRNCFSQFGWEALQAQLENEIWRISARNLGRDDRIISDHGKEARFPFLDEQFTSFISAVPIHKRANLQLPRGVGEKLLLRLSALKLGLRQTACHLKRAIQFGSKIAKLDDNKEKGSDVCERLV